MLERPDYVLVLERVAFLQETLANVEQQLVLYERQARELQAKSAEQVALIEQFEAQRATDKAKADVLDRERTRLQDELDARTFWSQMKDYGLIGLGALALALAVL